MKKQLTVGSLKQGETSIDPKKIEVPTIKVPTNNVQQPDRSPTTVYVTQNGKSYSIRPEKNRSLLDSALDQGRDLDFKCKKGTCGRCKVYLVKDISTLNPPNEQERVKLGDLVEKGFRLACQTRVE